MRLSRQTLQAIAVIIGSLSVAMAMIIPEPVIVITSALGFVTGLVLLSISESY